MNEPVIQANESLVRNGYFKEELKGWERTGLVGLDSAMYEGWLTHFMDVGVAGSATQVVTVPKSPAANARYELTFLCELQPGVSWSGDPGWLRILKGNEVLMEIELKAGASRNLEQDQACLAAGQPLDFKPIDYCESLEALDFTSGDELTFQISGFPANPADKRSRLCITHIDLQLQLEPLTLQAVYLDDEVLTPGGTLFLCLGASLGTDQDDRQIFKQHNLSFLLETGNAWGDTKMALTSPGNPMEAIRAVPDWGGEHEFATQWSLDCPWIGEEKIRDFSINLINQYNAEPYSIVVSLGHHRVAIRAVEEAAYYPVFECEQSVLLGVEVISYYTGQPLDGRTVTWTSSVSGVLGMGVTDEKGWVRHDFDPPQAGDFVITASIDSPYYASGNVTYEFAVKVLETDPWKDLRAVVEGSETDWEVTGYPNRGSDHPVIVRLSADSPLRGTELSLHWRGDAHEQLGVTVSPALNTPMPFDGEDIVWTLSSEDRLDGRFELSLVCSKLLLSSPGKPMSLARNRVRIADVREANKYPVVADREIVMLRLQVVHVTTRGDGEGVIDARVDWDTLDGPFSTRTGAGGWASLSFMPRQVGEQVVSASVKAYEGAVGIERKFDVKAIATSSWKDKVAITVDNIPIELRIKGVVCYRGETHTLQVEALPGSTLIGEDITLEWRGSEPGIGLVASDLGTPKTLPAEGRLSWTLESELAGSTSSMFEMKLTCAGLEDRELFGRLMKRDFRDELSVVLDQMTTTRGQQLYPCLGARHRYTLRPHALSPLVGLNVDLDWASGDTPEKLGITIEPALIIEQWLEDGGATWTLDCSNAPAPADFSLFFQTLFGRVDVNQLKMGHNKLRIEASHESAVDPVVGQEPAWMWLQVVSQFTGRVVGQVPVKWTVDVLTEVSDTAADGWSAFPYVPTTGGEKMVEAWVTSPYDGFEESRSMAVMALDGDPWSGLMVVFDKQAPQPWGQKTYFPRRKGQHRFTVTAPAGNPLLDRQLTLGMTGTGPRQLGIQFTPPILGVPKLFSSSGFSYDFTVGDLTDGGFALCLSSERLASLSPANAMSLGRGEPVMKIAERQRVNQTLLWGDAVTEQVTVVSAVSGRPMVGVTVTWRSPGLDSVTSTTNFYGVAKIDFVPTIPGTFELTATVGDELYSESMSLPFFLHEPRQIESLSSPDPSGYPGQEVSAQAIVVSALTGEPLVDVEVEWEYPGVTIASTKTDLNGKAEVSFKLPWIKEGWLYASVKGGYAGWVLQTLKFTMIENADIELQFDRLNTVVGDTVYPCIGNISGVYVRAKPDSPVRGSWVTLEWAGDSAESLGVEVSPPLGESLQLTEEGWVMWSLNCLRSTQNGKFSLTLKARDSEWSLPLVAVELGHNKVTAERWREDIEMGSGQILTKNGIRATSAYTRQLAPGVQVTVLRSNSSEPSYETTSQNGEAVVNTYNGDTADLKILNRYDGTIV